MARELFTYILKYWVFTSEKLPKKAVFLISQSRSCWRRGVLLSYELKFFFVLISSYIIHLSKFTKLSQCKAALSQITHGRLTIVLCNVLKRFRLLVPKFCENHSQVFIKLPAELAELRLDLLHLEQQNQPRPAQEHRRWLEHRQVPSSAFLLPCSL